MKDAGERTIRLLQLLKEHTDEEHILSMPQIIALLDEAEIAADRRSVYRSLDTLQRCGYDIRFVRTPIQGYYLKHDLSVADAVITVNAIRDSISLDEETSGRLSRLILDRLSACQRDKVYLTPKRDSGAPGCELTHSLSVLLDAIHHQNPVTFRYFDYTVTKQKRYRRNRQKYEAVPYAVVTDSGRYYCVMYSQTHKSFASYRIDKMESVTALSESADHVPFDVYSYMQASFRMYRGEPQTVVCRFDLSLSSIVFDQFGYDIMITAVDDASFTAAIRTSVSPTLISWLLQFSGKATVLRPQSLIEELLNISEELRKTYGG